MDIKHSLASETMNRVGIHDLRQSRVIQSPLQKKKSTLSVFQQYLPIPPMKFSEKANLGDNSCIHVKTIAPQEKSNETLNLRKSLMGSKAMVDQSTSKVNAATDALPTKQRRINSRLENTSSMKDDLMITADGRSFLQIPSPVKCCSREHRHKSRPTYTRRNLSGGRSVEPDKHSDISIDLALERQHSQHSFFNGTEQSIKIEKESSLEIISNQSKRNQLKVEAIKRKYASIDVSKEYPASHKNDISIRFTSTINPKEDSQSSAMTPQSSYIMRQQDSISHWHPPLRGSMQIPVSSIKKLDQETTKNTYNPLVSDGEITHQIGIFQWSKLQKETNHQPETLQIRNKADNRLNIGRLQPEDSPQKRLNEYTPQKAFRIKATQPSKSDRKVKFQAQQSEEKLSTLASIQSARKKLLQNSIIQNGEKIYARHNSDMSLQINNSKHNVEKQFIVKKKQSLESRFQAVRKLQKQQAPLSAEKYVNPGTPQKNNPLYEYFVKFKSEIVKDIMIESGDKLLKQAFSQAKTRPATAMSGIKMKI